MPSADQCSKSNSTSAIDWRRGRYAGYDKPLSFHFTIDDLSIISRLGLPRQPKARNDAIRSIVIDTLVEANGLNRAISYSRNRNFYANLQRYNGTSYSYANVVQGVDLLAVNGWLYTDIAPANPHLGLQSTIQPTRLLLDTFGPDIIKSNIRHKIFEPIHLNTGPKKSRRLVDYKDTDKTYRMRRQVIAINEMLASFAITLDHATDYRREGHLIHFISKEKNNAVVTVNTFLNQLYRVFNEDFNKGGRFYNGWWQSVPKTIRELILIDNQRTVEPDHSQLHPRLIYAEAGIKLNGDAYDIHGWDRDVCKRAFNIMINAPSYQSALGAIAEKLSHFGTDRRMKAKELISEIRRRHRPIEDYLNSGYGRHLQFKDAQMAGGVISSLKRQGIPCLPVHDSYRVATKHEGATLEAMHKAECIAGI